MDAVLHDAAPLPGGAYPLRLAAHLREHLLWMRVLDRAEGTIRARRRAVVRLAEFLGHDPGDATVEELKAWQMRVRQTSVAALRLQTSLVRPYYRWLRDAGVRPDNPAALLPVPRQKRRVPRPIAEDTLERVIARAPARLLPWLVLAGWSGLRAAEIAGLRTDDFVVDEHGQVWVRVIGKGGGERTVAVPDWAWPTIAEALASSGPAWRRVRGFGHVEAAHVSNYCNRYLHRVVGVPDTLHSLRHRFATQTYEQTGDLRLVQDALGHASALHTAGYTRIASRKQAAAVAALPRPVLPIPTPPGGRRLHVVDPSQEGTTA